MRDAMEARFWADHHLDFSDNVVRLLKGVRGLIEDARVGLERLNEIEFDAPWRRGSAPAERDPAPVKRLNPHALALVLAIGFSTVMLSFAADLVSVI